MIFFDGVFESLDVVNFESVSSRIEFETLHSEIVKTYNCTNKQSQSSPHFQIFRIISEKYCINRIELLSLLKSFEEIEVIRFT
eukprot:UN28034